MRLLRKEGGRSGLWERDTQVDAEIDAEDDEAPVPAPSPLPGGPNTGDPAPAIAFVGYQNSGKTTLVEKVISRLFISRLSHRGVHHMPHHI